MEAYMSSLVRKCKKCGELFIAESLLQKKCNKCFVHKYKKIKIIK